MAKTKLKRGPITGQTPLSPLQQAFVHQYMLDRNAARAYRDAGYKPGKSDGRGQAAYKLLHRPNVAAAVAAATKAQQERLAVTSDMVVARLWTEATREGEDASHTARVSALELLGKRFGLFKERIELTGKNGAPMQLQYSGLQPEDVKKLSTEELLKLRNTLHANADATTTNRIGAVESN